MNEQFYKLPQEKQLRIINAALEVFAKHEYKHASTEDIAAKAGISKGMLFYYFHNKKELYMYIYDYCRSITLRQVCDDTFEKLDDYFAILEYSAMKKAKLMEENPYLMDFAVRTFYSAKEDVSEDVQKINREITDQMMGYFRNIDMSRFVEGTDVGEITRMLLWMTDGYMNERLRAGQTLSQKEIMQDFRKWVTMFKKLAYKKEYQ